MADIELEETNRVDDREAEKAGTAEEETSFIDDDGRLDESILIPVGFNSDVDGSRPSGSTPNIGRYVGVMKWAYTQDKKRFPQKGTRSKY